MIRLASCLLFLFISLIGKTYAQEVDGQSIKEQIDTLHSQAINSWLNYPDSAIKLVRKSFKLSEQLQDKKLISKSLRLIGAVLYYKGEYDSVIYYSTKSYNIAFDIQDSVLMNNALNNIGLANYNLGSYQNALEYLLRSLNMKKALKEVYGLATTLNNIGLVYDKLKDYEQARVYFLQAVEIAEHQKDNNNILYSQNNIGLTYVREKNLEEAERYFRLSMAVDVDNKVWKAVTYCGMGQVYQERGEFENSDNYFSRSLVLRNEIGDRRGISEIYYFQSRKAQLNHEFDSALVLLGKSQEIAERIGSKDRIFENFELYVEVYNSLGDVKSAFEYQTKLMKLRDQLFNENMARNLSDIQLRIQEADNQRALAVKEKEIAENERFVIFLIIIIFLVLLIAGLTFYQVNVNIRKNKILALRNKEINYQKEEIESQKESLVEKNNQLESAHIMIRKQNDQLEQYNRQLRSTVDEKSDQLKERNDQLILANLELDNFIYKSSHDIKGPLATLLGMCNVALLDIKEEQARSYFQMLYDTAIGLNSILARLKTISDISNLELKFKPIDFNEIINNCLEQNRKIEGDENIDATISIDNNVKCVSDPVLFDMIFFNILQSVIKMRDKENKNGIILIDIAKEAASLRINIMDKGSNLAISELGDVFELFKKNALQHRTLGLGLYIVKQSVIKLGGHIILLDDNSHTHFKISIPLV